MVCETLSPASTFVTGDTNAVRNPLLAIPSNVVTNLKKTEFTYNPEVIFEPDFSSDLIKFNGIVIGQNLTELPIELISEFYDKEGKSQNTDIKNGWVLTNNGIQYVLKNEIVKMILSKESGITKLNGFDKVNVEQLSGKPNNISNDSITWVWENVVNANVHN